MGAEGNIFIDKMMLWAVPEAALTFNMCRLK